MQHQQSSCCVLMLRSRPAGLTGRALSRSVFSDLAPTSAGWNAPEVTAKDPHQGWLRRLAGLTGLLLSPLGALVGARVLTRSQVTSEPSCGQQPYYCTAAGQRAIRSTAGLGCSSPQQKLL